MVIYDFRWQSRSSKLSPPHSSIRGAVAVFQRPTDVLSPLLRRRCQTRRGKTVLQEPDRRQHFYGCFCFLRGHNSMLSRGANHSGWITHFCPRLLIQEELRITVHFKRTLGLPCRISYEQKHDVVALNRKKNARSICTRR